MDQLVPKPYILKLCIIKKDTTISGYKKSEAFKELKTSINSGILDKALFWGIELDKGDQELILNYEPNYNKGLIPFR